VTVAAEVLREAAAFRGAALKTRGLSKANPAYLAIDVDLLTRLLIQAKEAHTAFEAEHGPHDDWPRFYAEHILGRHIDNPPERS
jgi:hypothetical protein